MNRGKVTMSFLERDDNGTAKEGKENIALDGRMSSVNLHREARLKARTLDYAGYTLKFSNGTKSFRLFNGEDA